MNYALIVLFAIGCADIGLAIGLGNKWAWYRRSAWTSVMVQVLHLVLIVMAVRNGGLP